MTNPEKPVHIYFVKSCPEVPPPTNVNIFEFNLEKKIMYATSWGEMAELFKLRPGSLCVNAAFLEDTSLFEIINMIDTFAKLVGIEKEVSITLGINKTTPYKLVKEAQKTRITGIIPSGPEFGLDECIKGIQAQWANIPYWPKHIIDQLAGSKPPKVLSTTEIKLTPRQGQILNMVLERGASNKVIARTLNISESTVKLHLGHIFKKYGVKNRTQLAVFARK